MKLSASGILHLNAPLNGILKRSPLNGILKLFSCPLRRQQRAALQPPSHSYSPTLTPHSYSPPLTPHSYSPTLTRTLTRIITPLPLLLSLILLLLLPLASFAQSGALPPYTFVGKITSYAGVQYSTNSAVEIRVKNLQGVLLAKSAIRLSDESPYNYRLTVPVASAPATGYATVGEGLIFEIFDGVSTTYTTLVPAAQAVVGDPGGISIVNVSLSLDSNGNGIPDQYENYITYLMSVHGIAGPYDHEADYDGDGMSNRAEFLAGTDPLNAADYLKIIATAETPSGLTADGLFAITFVSAAGRSYSVRATDDLKKIDTAERDPFKTDPASSATQTYLHTANFQAEAITLYLIPQGSTRFYRLVVE